MRMLTVVPMIHTQQEFGSLEKQMTSLRQRAHGIRKTEQFFADIESYWEEVERRIAKTCLVKSGLFSQLHIFIDSLPITDEVSIEAIIRACCDKKISAYVIAVTLREKGAHIHETEDVGFLVEEYAYWKGRLERGEPENIEKERRILQNRDAVIVERINAIVPDGESALLFIGALHRVRDMFCADPAWTVVDL